MRLAVVSTQQGARVVSRLQRKPAVPLEVPQHAKDQGVQGAHIQVMYDWVYGFLLLLVIDDMYLKGVDFAKECDRFPALGFSKTRRLPTPPNKLCISGT